MGEELEGLSLLVPFREVPSTLYFLSYDEVLFYYKFKLNVRVCLQEFLVPRLSLAWLVLAVGQKRSKLKN